MNPFTIYTDSELQALELCLKADLARRAKADKTVKGTKRKVRTVAGEYVQTFELNGEIHEVKFTISASKSKQVSDSKFGNRLATLLAFALAREQVNDVFNGEEVDVSSRVSSIIAEHGSCVSLDTAIDPAIEAIYKVRRQETFPSTIPKGRTSFHGVDQLVTS